MMHPLASPRGLCQRPQDRRHGRRPQRQPRVMVVHLDRAGCRRARPARGHARVLIARLAARDLLLTHSAR
eukprot:2232413-Pyramimonas_sp.AAC.1